MQFPKRSGILLHPSSLPGDYGIGEIGPQAYQFIDHLNEAGQQLWQVLPLGPTGYGDSPYQSLSTFAGNPMLISMDRLVADGLLDSRKTAPLKKLPKDHTDYGTAIPARMAVLQSVCRTFERRASTEIKRRYDAFLNDNDEWLYDYALFAALKSAHGGQSWTQWDSAYVERDEKALRYARRKYATAIRNVCIEQFLFFDQWARLRNYAHSKGISIIGDMPIFVAHDSADVWAAKELFTVDERGHLTVQAGVPPDYFSKTGQLWGNPLYRWDAHREQKFDWWKKRLQQVFTCVDILRIDHFRGFEACWEVPGKDKTAENGKWVKCPGQELFDTLEHDFKDLPIIAEDLGVITDEVDALRDRYAFPGMRILQFSFGPDEEDKRPHQYPENCVAYTGTHDNDTTYGWFHAQAGKDSTRTAEQIEQEQQMVLQYLQEKNGDEIHWAMIACAMHTKAHTVVVPIQDVLGLGSDARMNRPGQPGGNWQWRMQDGQWTHEEKERLAGLADETGRIR